MSYNKKQILFKESCAYPIWNNHIVYTLLKNGQLISFDWEAKKIVWVVEANLGHKELNSNAVFLTENCLYVNIGDTLIVINPTDGSVIKEFYFNDLNMPPCSGSRNFFVTYIYNKPKDAFEVLLFEKENLVYSFFTQDYVSDIYCSDNKCFIVESGSKILCIDLTAYKLIWTYNVVNKYSGDDDLLRQCIVQSLKIHNRCLIVGLEGYGVIGINTSSGVVEWSQRKNIVFSQNMKCVNEEIVVLEPSFLNMINSNNGDVIKKINLKKEMRKYHLDMIGNFLIQGQFLYFTTCLNSGHIAELDMNTYKIKIMMELGSPIPLNAPIDYYNGYLFTSDYNGNYYMIYN